MKQFDSFLTEADDATVDYGKPRRMSDSLVSVFGRHNPPHAGHGATFDRAQGLSEELGGADQRFYTSRSQDPKSNPLPFEMKLNFLKKMFPKHANKWDDDPNVRTILNSATKAHGEGYKDFHFIGGDDRRQSMEDLLRKYNGDLYNFNNIFSHSAGMRDPNSDDPLAALSASKMRNHVKNGDLESFREGMPSKTAKGFQPKQLFDAIQMFGMQNEELDPEAIRELYATGQLFREGEWVESLTTCLVGRVHRCGANHLICVTEDGIMFKNFIHDVQYI